MKYKLIKDSDAGVIIDPTPILRDIEDTFTVSFVLPENGIYIALFRDESGAEYRVTIKNSVAKVPKQILDKEQRIGLTVCLLDGEKIVHSWECHTLKVGTFLSLRKTQWQITAGVDDRAVFERMSELECLHIQKISEVKEFQEQIETAFETLKKENMCETERMRETIDSIEKETSAQSKLLADLKTSVEKISTAYNAAIEVVNDLSQRMSELEANYDPTIIK